MFITISLAGNVHEAMQFVNKLRCAQFLFQVVALQPGCILIFKVPAREDQIAVRKELGLKSN